MTTEENTVSSDYVVKTLPVVRLVARRAVLELADLSSRIGPMFDEVAAGLRDIPGSLATPIATYADTGAGIAVVVGYAYAGEPPAGAEVVELAEVRAACEVHLGPVAKIEESWEALHRWVLENGHAYAGPSRELYVRAESEDQADWIMGCSSR